MSDVFAALAPVPRLLFRILGLAGALFLAEPQAVGAERPFPQVQARVVLALYDGTVEASPAETRVHRFAEMPLNHLGYVVTYRDTRDSLPPAASLSEFAGVLTWFAAPPQDRVRYLAWAAEAARSGTKFVILGAIGGEFWTADLRAMNSLLHALGLHHFGRAVHMTFGTQIRDLDHKVIAFERELDPVLPTYPVVRSVAPDIQPWLELAVPIREGGGKSVVVATGPRGGYAADGYEIVREKYLDRVRWLIDPFRFLAEALNPQAGPVPDLTTRSGRRIYFSHVNGDGLTNVFEVAGKQVLVPQIFLASVVRAYPDLPVTFALTAGDVDPEIGGNETPKDIVRAIWNSPNAEPSVNSYTRPLRWSFFRNYDRKIETAMIEQAAAAGGADREPGRAEASKFIATSSELPRYFLVYPFDLTTEVTSALNVARMLAPPEKPIRLYQWTGDAQPFEEVVARTRDAGLLNMNGGESRYDSEYPSVAYVAPISRPVGHMRQTYSVGAGEVTYSKAWKPIAQALRGLGATMFNTETPRRLKPLNLHYSVSSVGDPDHLKIIRAYLDEVRKTPLMPITASQYAQMADNFASVMVTRVANQTWEIRNRGTIQTFRIDNSLDRDVDISESVGVLGTARQSSSLYIALDASADVVRIVTRVDAQPFRRSPTMRDSRWDVQDLRRWAGGWSFRAFGFGPGEFTWDSVPPGVYSAIATSPLDDVPVWQQNIRADSDGCLTFTVPAVAPTLLSFRIMRIAPHDEAQR